MRYRTLIGVVSLAAMTVCAAAPANAEPTPASRPAELRLGACEAPGELVTSLADLFISFGDPQGQSAAMPVEQSGTVVPYTVSDLLNVAHIVTVQKSAEELGATVACGEVGGTLNPDGTLAVGMRALNGSGLSGVAYFTPNPGFDNTLITILLVPDGSSSTTTTGTEIVETTDPAA